MEVPKSYDEAISMGAKPLENVRAELHDYVDKLSELYAQKSGIELGLEDIKSGNVYKAENSADLVKQNFPNL